MNRPLADSKTPRKRSLTATLKRHAGEIDAAAIRDLAAAMERDEIAQAADCVVGGRALSWEQLRALTPYMVHAKSHDLYERAVALFDGALAFPADARPGRFITGGKGGGSLNTYRKLSANGQPLFEKLYLRDSSAWQRARHFHDEVLPQLEPDFPTPRILARTQGDRLMRVCFEFVEFRKCSTDCTDKAERILRRISKLAGPPEDFAFTDNPRYRLARHRLLALLDSPDNPLPPGSQNVILEWERILLDHPTVFSHGDLKRSNLSQDGVAVDWDESGFFPPGFDLAVLLSDYIRPRTLAQARAALERRRLDFGGTRGFAGLVFFLVVFTALKGRAASAHAGLLREGVAFLRDGLEAHPGRWREILVSLRLTARRLF